MRPGQTALVISFGLANPGPPELEGLAAQYGMGWKHEWQLSGNCNVASVRGHHIMPEALVALAIRLIKNSTNS